MTHVLYYVLWITAPVLQAGLAVQMLRRRLHAVYPAFFWYLVFNVVRFLCLFSIDQGLHSARAYFATYWIAEAADIVLTLVVIHELYSHVFRSYEGLRALQSVLFRWAAAVLILVAVVSAASASGTDADRSMAGILVLDRSMAIVKAGLLFFLLVFSSYFGIKWQHCALGIATGLLLYFSVEVAALAVRSELGSIAANTAAVVKSGAYNCAVLVWMGYFLAKEPVSRTVTVVPRNDLAKWNEVLLELLNR